MTAIDQSQVTIVSKDIIMMDIYSHLCLTDESFRDTLIATGPQPFRLQYAQPWGYVPNHTAARADLISNILIEVSVCATSNTLPPVSWLKQKQSRPGTLNQAQK